MYVLMYCWWFRSFGSHRRQYGDSRWLEVLPPTLPENPLRLPEATTHQAWCGEEGEVGPKTSVASGFEQHWIMKKSGTNPQKMITRWRSRTDFYERFIEIHIISKNLVYVCTLRCQVRACPPKKNCEFPFGMISPIEKCGQFCSGPHHTTTGKLRTFDLQTGVSL